MTKGIKHTKFKKTSIGEIPEEWEIKSIGDLLKERVILELQDGNHGELHPKQQHFTRSGIPCIAANCITNNRISFDKCQFLPEERLKKLRIGFAKGNDVILNHKGTLCPTAIVPQDKAIVILSPQTTYYRDFSTMYFKVISFWFDRRVISN
ncbi:MAG: hypothetical protein M3Y53_00505 [Thermoproteota archaeon]|nr:hypothetical protein [Thermoproteota archaeon]